MPGSTRPRILLAAAPHLLFRRPSPRVRDTRGFRPARQYKPGRLVTMLTRETAPHLGSHMLGAAARGRPRVVVAGAISALYVAIAVAGVLRGDATTAAALLLCGVIT